MSSIALVAATLLIVPSAVFAACDVRDFIFEDKIINASDDLVRLSVLSETVDSLSEDEKKRVDAGLVIPGYLEGSYSDDMRRAIVSRQERMLDLDLTQESRRTVIQSHLSDTSAKMYEACLEDDKLIIKTPDHATESKEFFAFLQYDPGPEAAEEADMFVGSKPAIFITNGQVPESFYPFIPAKIRKGQELRVLVERDIDQVTEIVANIGARSQSAVLPPVNNKRLEFFLKSKEESSNSWAKSPTDYKEFCVSSEPGEVLFPETMRVIDKQVVPKNGLNKSTPLPQKSTEYQVCASVESRAADSFTGGSITSVISVIAARVVE